MQRNPITPAGYKVLVASLEHHRKVLRPQCVQDIAEARAHGDLSENAEYDAAKDRQGMVEAQTSHLEGLVASAEIIDVAKLPRDGRLVFGMTVRIENEDGVERKYRIVGETEADIDRGLISYKAPLARALIGRRVGDEARVTTPGGEQNWEILEVSYEE